MDGIIIVNKPRGITSFDIVRYIRKLANVKKVGHGGTLDPIAEGVLPIFLGKATKKVKYFLEGDKGYFGEMTLGIVTDTLDSEGKIKEKKSLSEMGMISVAKIIEVFNMFKGNILQVPPMFSAKRHEGQRLYKLARLGKTVERKPREVNIFKIELLDYLTEDPPRVRFGVFCSKGTYIRSLIQDIGEKLGCGAHLNQLIRTYSHPFVLSQALSLETIKNFVKAGKLDDIVLNVDEILEVLFKEKIDEQGIVGQN